MSEGLIKSGVLDTLAVKNQELALIKRVEKKKLRDKNLVTSYLYNKFPLAVRENLPEIPEKEFPRLLEKAKRYYLIKTAVAGAWTIASIIGTISIFTISVTQGWIQTVSWSSALYAFGGLFLSLFTGFSCYFPIRKLVRCIRMLTRG